MNRVFVVVLCAVLVGACGKKSLAPSSPDVWAVVDGREIRRDMVEKAYRSTPQMPTPASDEEALTAKLNLLNELIIKDILASRAKALGVTVTDDDVTKAFNERRQNMTDEMFQQELSKRQLSADDIKAWLRRELTAQKVIEHEVTSKITVSEQEIASFFNANRAQFNLAEPAFRIAQIVITPVADPQITNRKGDDAATPEAATRKLDMLLERLRGGAPFAELAMDYSEDPRSAPQGGDLGFIPLSALNQVPPVLKEIVLKSEPGTVKTASQGGAHTLVMVVEREAAGQRELTSPGVRDTVTSTLRGRKEQLLRTAYLTAARNDSTVVNYFARSIVASPGTLPTLAPPAPGK